MRFPWTHNLRQTPAAQAQALLLVLASVAASAAIRLALDPLVGHRVAFITFFPALVFSAWIGGWTGGLTALALSALAASWFISPTHSLLVAGRTDQITLIVFVIVGLSVSALSSAQHRASRDAAQAAEDAKQNVLALQDSETRKSTILEVALDCIITMDVAGRIVDFNPAAEATFGYAASEVRGKPIAETIVPPSLRDAHRAGLAHYLAAGVGPVLGRRIEIVGMRKNGEEFPVEIAIVPMEQHGTPQFTAYLRDISERKALEAAQARLADANRLLLDSTGEGIYGIDTAGRFTFVNQSAARMLGYAAEELIGQSGHSLIHCRPARRLALPGRRLPDLPRPAERAKRPCGR